MTKKTKKTKKKANRLNILRRFAVYYKPVLGVFVLDSVFATIGAAATVSWPIIIQALVDSAETGNTRLLYILIAVFATLVFVGLVSTAYITYWGHLMGIRMEIRMRKIMVEKLHKLPMSKFDKTDVGTFISRIVTDMKDIPEFAHHAPEDLIVGVLTLLGGFIYAFLQSWILGIALLIIFIPGVIMSYKKHKEIWSIWEKIKDKNSKISDIIGKQVDSITEIKSYSAIDLEQSRVAKYQKEYQKAWNKFYLNETVFSLTNMLTRMMFITAALAIGAIQYSNGQVSIGQFVGLITVAAFMGQPVQKFAILYIMTAEGLSSVTRFFDFLALEEEPNLGKKKAFDFKGEIEFKDVKFSYIDEKNERITVFKNLNLKFQAGKTTALIGETGIGKSTLVKLILRYYEIDSGQILIDGHDITDFDIHEYRKKLTYVQQSPIIFDDTIYNNIKYNTPNLSLEDAKKVAKLAQLDEHISGLKDQYMTMAGTKGAKLSGGQKQRLALARAFSTNAPVLIMDEPTSSLDNATEKKIKEVVSKLTNRRTSIIIAHRLTTIKDADIVIVLGKYGVVLEKGTHDELLKNKNYYYTLNNV